MRFEPLSIVGAFLVHLDLLQDERGFFARTFDSQTFAAVGLDYRVVQCNTSFNRRKRTLRGLHYQLHPHAEGKLIRCTRGALFDVGIDLRADSPSFLTVVSTELRVDAPRLIFLPGGVAHGFLTLEDETEVAYQMSEAYHPASARGIRWNDPSFDIPWPVAPDVISERDRLFPDFAS